MVATFIKMSGCWTATATRIERPQDPESIFVPLYKPPDFRRESQADVKNSLSAMASVAIPTSDTLSRKAGNPPPELTLLTKSAS